jgi:tetratricopeptide (TPR) repeat protein
LGDGVERMDKFQAEQLRCFKQALDYRQSLVKQDPANVKYRRGVAVMLAKVGGASMPDKASAVDYVTRAVAAFKALADENPENVQVRRGYAWSLYTLAWTLAETGDHAAAVSPHRQALAIREQIAAADPKDVQAQFDLAVAHANLADALTNSGQPEEAIAHSTQAVAIVEPMIAGDPGNSSYIRNCALFYVWAGNAHAALASRESADASVQLVHWTEAQAAYQRAKTLLAEQSAKGALRPDDASTLAGLTASLAKCEEQITRLKK